MDPVAPSEQFAADFKKLLQDVEEFKQFQRSGQDSVRMYRVFSGSASDKTVTSVAFNNRKFRLTFTPDSGAERGLVYKMEYTYTEGSGDPVSILSERESVDNADGSQSWIFVVNGSDFSPNSSVGIKFYFWASGTGTFSTTNL